MLSGVNGVSSLSYDHQAPPAQSRPPAKPTSSGEDSVQLSAAAKAALGDADHDGDSK